MISTTRRAKSIVLLILTCCSLVSLVSANSDEEIRELHRRVFDAIVAGDAEVIAAAFAENAQVVRPGRAALQGRAAIQQSFERWFRNSSDRAYNGLQIELRTYHDTIAVRYATYIIKWVDRQGRTYERHRRSTATLVKHDGRWLLVSAHVSNLPR